MEYSEIIYLVNSVKEEDEIGNITTSFFTLTKRFAKKQSIRTNEFYSAVESGITPSIEFVMKRLDYEGQTELEYNKKRYSVIRTIDPKNKFDIVLVCAKKIGINGEN
jgi:SPP1 family predicted phage head-tail adaptor